MRLNIRSGIIPFYVALCLILGGASAAGAWANMVLQLLGVMLIAWSLMVKRSSSPSRAAVQLLALVALTFAIILIQLVPLPPDVWTALPGRDSVANGFKLLGQPLPWLPISLAPYNSVASALALLPASAVILGIVRLGAYKDSWLAWAVILIAAMSVLVGALQLTGGAYSPWYFYTITNRGFTTGFFANANHMATLLVVTIPLIAAVYLHARKKARQTQHSAALMVLLAGSLGVVLTGLVINTSLAGLGLATPVVLGTLMMILMRNRQLSARWLIAALPLVAASVFLIFTEPFGNNLTSANASIDPTSRHTSFIKSWQATLDFMPFGSGVGTFADIYKTYEDFRLVDPTYMNHVHGDYIEVALEAGLPGIIVIALFLLWWLNRVAAAWLSNDFDPYPRAATIATGAILAHSIVDYPLRTAAISAVFAACCALLTSARPFRRAAKDPTQMSVRHLSAD